MHIWGLEVETAYELRDRLRLNGSLSWQKGSQRAEPGADRTPPSWPPTGCASCC